MQARGSFRWRAGYGPVLIYCCVLFASFSLALALGQVVLFVLISIVGLAGLFIAGAYWRQIRSAIGPDRDYFKGASLIVAGKPAEALELSREYRLRTPQTGLSGELAGMALDALDRREEALAEADRAVRTKKRWQGLMIRGGILLRMSLPAEALRDLEESYLLGGNLIARWQIGAAFLSLRRLDDADRILEWSKRVMKYSFVSLAAAECQRLLGNHQRAHEYYFDTEERARREIESGKPHEAILAYSLARMGRDAAAIETADEALERNPGDVLALTAHALVNVLRGEAPLALVNLRRLMLIDPQQVAGALTDPQFTHLLTEPRFRELLAWALGAQRQTRERLRERFPHLFA